MEHQHRINYGDIFSLTLKKILEFFSCYGSLWRGKNPIKTWVTKLIFCFFLVLGLLYFPYTGYWSSSFVYFQKFFGFVDVYTQMICIIEYWQISVLDLKLVCVLRYLYGVYFPLGSQMIQNYKLKYELDKFLTLAVKVGQWKNKLRELPPMGCSLFK